MIQGIGPVILLSFWRFLVFMNSLSLVIHVPVFMFKVIWVIWPRYQFEDHNILSTFLKVPCLYHTWFWSNTYFVFQGQRSRILKSLDLDTTWYILLSSYHFWRFHESSSSITLCSRSKSLESLDLDSNLKTAISFHLWRSHVSIVSGSEVVPIFFSKVKVIEVTLPWYKLIYPVVSYHFWRFHVYQLSF